MPEDEWQKYALFDQAKPYTRNLIATDGTTYTLLLLCWNPGQESPIHDHPCDGCWLQVLKGSVRECRYDSQLNCIADDTFHEQQVSYITDSMGYHKVGNNTTDIPSISLHLYAPPFHQCRVWKHTETSGSTAVSTVDGEEKSSNGITTAATSNCSTSNSVKISQQQRRRYDPNRSSISKFKNFSEYGHLTF